MAFRKTELSSEDLAAFDLVIGYLKDTSQHSMSLREFLFNGLNDAANTIIAKERIEREVVDKIRAGGRISILSELFEGINPDNITLGQLNQEISLRRLIEIRQKLESRTAE